MCVSRDYATMPRYFFHVFNDEQTHDEEGQEFPDLARARLAAEQACRILAAHSIVEHGHFVRGHRVEIANAHGETLAVVSFGDVVQVE